MKYILLGTFCASQTVRALAQEKVLPPVEVAAEGTSSPTLESIEDARERIRRVPEGVNIVDAEQYRERRVSTPPDALQFSPGVSAASRFGEEEARISIRGSGLQRTFHMRDLQLLQDGTPGTAGSPEYHSTCLSPSRH
jgi:iron complex outermembrane receptor protein